MKIHSKQLCIQDAQGFHASETKHLVIEKCIKIGNKLKAIACKEWEGFCASRIRGKTRIRFSSLLTEEYSYNVLSIQIKGLDLAQDLNPITH